MRSKGDELRRLSCYATHGKENPAAAAAMAAQYAELSNLITDETTREVFNVTYIRITGRYDGGDFARQFRALFRATLKEVLICYAKHDNNNKKYNDAIFTEGEEGETPGLY